MLVEMSGFCCDVFIFAEGFDWVDNKLGVDYLGIA
jgi:hypothetical protein